MGHYDDIREKMKMSEDKKVNDVVGEVVQFGSTIAKAGGQSDVNLSRLMIELRNARAEVDYHMDQLKRSDRINEFVEKARSAGAMGMIGLLPQISELGEELAPAYKAFVASKKVESLMMQVIGEMAEKIDKLEVK